MNKSKKIFAICDLEESYVVRLADYLNRRKMVPFEVQAFTNLTSLLDYSQDNHIEILLISTEAMSDEVKRLDVSRTIILYDGEELNLEERENCVYKYQATDCIAREVMNLYTGGSGALKFSLQQAGCEVLGVYSPVARCGKTMFALTLGEILSETEKTLYLNLEDYSGFESLFATSYQSDITDFVSLARRGDGSFAARRESMVHTFRNLDYIPPAFFPNDLRVIRPEEWNSFLARILTPGPYRYLILDIGNEPADVPQLLQLCSRIYMPLATDPVSRAKLSQFEKDMEALSMTDVMERTVRLYLPKAGPKSGTTDLTDDLLYGRMGQFVRKMLREEAAEAG